MLWHMYAEIFLYKADFLHIFHIVVDNFGIVGNNRTVIVVIAEVLVKVV